MKAVLLPVLVLAPLVSSSQVFYRDMEDVVLSAGCIFLARVVSVEDSSCSGSESAVFVLEPLQTIEGHVGSGAGLTGIYSVQAPFVYTGVDGTQVTESPIYDGSGIEFAVVAGDTVIVIAWDDVLSVDECFSIVRMEPAGSLGAVVDLVLEKDGGEGAEP
jgi:hypothetical protein